jgi:uncharacterized protein HemX
MNPDKSRPNSEQEPNRRANGIQKEKTIEFDFVIPERPAPFAPVVIKADPQPKEFSSTTSRDTANFDKANLNQTRPSSVDSKPKKTTNPTSPMALSTPTISDFRKNTEKQAREQKSFDSILSTIAYSLIAGLVLVAGLAGFGGYVLYKQIQQQSVTVAQLDDKYRITTQALQTSLEDANKDITSLNDTLAKQRAQISKLTAASEEALASLRDEKQSRADLLKRVKTLESTRAIR